MPQPFATPLGNQISQTYNPLDPFNRAGVAGAFDPANPGGIPPAPVIAPQTCNPLDPFGATGVAGAFDPANPTGVPVQMTPAPSFPNYNTFDPFNAAGVPGAFDPANPGANPPGIPGEPAGGQAPNAAPAPAPITSEYGNVPTSDPPGAAPANADPGQAAPGPDGYSGDSSGAGSVGQGNQGTVGYGGGQPAYGGYDPDPDQGNDYGDRNQPGGFQGEDVGPIILDLSGQGINLTQLTSSNQFEVGEDNYQHRTAWAGAGSAVLFVDPNGDNAIRNADQYVFSDWDPSASSDMEALRDVFDTNHDGKLDAGDADFAQFKLMVTHADGTTSVETLAQAGITSIDLEANSVTRSYADGSSIDGETTYTKTDGSTGTAASVTLEQVAAGTVLETPLITKNPDGSTTIDDATLHPDGSLATETISTTSADRLTKTIAFDDAGNGIIDHRQTDATTVAADGSRTETVSDLAADGSTIDRENRKSASVSAAGPALPRHFGVKPARRHLRPHGSLARTSRIAYNRAA